MLISAGGYRSVGLVVPMKDQIKSSLCVCVCTGDSMACEQKFE